MNIIKILDEIQKDHPKVLLFPASLDAKEVRELTPELHKTLAYGTIKKLEDTPWTEE